MELKFMSTIFVIILLAFSTASMSSPSVLIEFLYYDQFCGDCPEHQIYVQVYLHNSQILDRIKNEYGDAVQIQRIFWSSSEGGEKIKAYHLSFSDWNTIIVNGEVVLKGGDRFVDEAQLRQIIDNYLAMDHNNMTNEIDKLSFMSHIFLAFTFGFFETFSPCLLALLSFLVSYTIGETISFKEGFSKILIFGTGFLSAALLTSTLATSLFFIMPFRGIITLIVCVLAIFFGLNAIGIDVMRLFKERKQQDSKAKAMVQKLARKYANKYSGMIVMGFLFYFLDPCIAPLFFAIVPLILNINFTTVVIAFYLGVMFPFVLIGILTGSLSRLARISYKHRSKLRLISGLILICYSIYLLVSYLFSSFFLR